MTDRYVDSAALGAGTGSSGAPFQSLALLGASGLVTNGDRIIIDNTLREAIPAAAIAANDLTIISRSISTRAIITGADIVPTASWVATAYPNVYVYQLAGNTGGNVAESGYVMTCLEWVSLAATAAVLQPGSFTYDSANSRVYMRPSMTLRDAVYEVATRTSCMVDTASFDGITFDGIEFKQGSRTLMQIINRTGIEVKNCRGFYAGGNQSGGYYVGNGIELSAGVIGFRVHHNEFVQIFDSAISPQLYNNTTTVGNGRIDHNEIDLCGFHNIELSQTLAPTGNAFFDIEVDHNTIRRAGAGWRFEGVTADGIFVGVESTACTFRDINIHHNLMIDCPWAMRTALRLCTVTGVRWESNVSRMTTPQTTGNSRGIHSDGDGEFENNLIDGHLYGAVLFGSAAGTYATGLWHNSFVDVAYGLLADTTGGTTTMTARNNLFMTSDAGVSFLRTFNSTGLTLDIDYCAIRSGLGLGGASIGANSVRPTVAEVGMDANRNIPLTSTLVGLGTHRRYGKDSRGKQRWNRPCIGHQEPHRLRAARTLPV